MGITGLKPDDFESLRLESPNLLGTELLQKIKDARELPVSDPHNQTELNAKKQKLQKVLDAIPNYV
jgi:hypothetical protein